MQTCTLHRLSIGKRYMLTLTFLPIGQHMIFIVGVEKMIVLGNLEGGFPWVNGYKYPYSLAH